MALITRQSKGTKLSIAEMDGNLTYLEELAQQGGGGSSGPQGPEGQSGPQGPEGGSGGGGSSYYDNGNSSQNTEIDWSRASLQKIAIDNNPTLSFTGATAGQKLTLLLKQVIGEGKKTITWSDGVFWRDGEEFNLKKVNSVALDESFAIGAGFNSGELAIALQPDGGILVGGGFTEFDGNPANYLVRLNADGSIDTGFDIGTGFNGGVLSIALQPDGKILVGGQFTSFDGNAANRLVRLNADGSIDTGFGIGDGFSGTVRSIALQPDGRILVGGSFNTFDGNYSGSSLARLNADGSIDTGFDIGTGFSGGVLSIVLQPDGGILVGGGFNSFDDDYSNNRLVRLNADGSIDTGFDIGTGFNNLVYSIALQPDGGILTGGFFTQFDGNAANRLVRLNADGSLDESFDIGTGFSGGVLSIVLQPDGKILVGGSFNSFDDDSAKSPVRLNPDGSLDTGFDIGAGFNDLVILIVLQADGKILVGGDFNSFDGNPANCLARLIELSGDIYTPVNIYYTGDEYIGDY
jgi:uncharacterized delta-60 repeat protein